MHNPALQAMGLDLMYLAFDVKPETLSEVLPAMGQMGFLGCNLTIPHKEVAFELLSDISEEARLAGSVNTIRFLEDGRMQGHSTDGYGLHEALREAFGVAFSEQSVAVLGCGGAGRAAALKAASSGARSLLLANRTLRRAESLGEELRTQFPSLKIELARSWPPTSTELADSDVLLQCSAAGMKAGDPPLLPPESFRKEQRLLDMTYVQQETPTMASARAAGLEACNGLGMLLHQGVKSLEIWTGQQVPVEPMRQALQQAVYGESSS